LPQVIFSPLVSLTCCSVIKQGMAFFHTEFPVRSDVIHWWTELSRKRRENSDQKVSGMTKSERVVVTSFYSLGSVCLRMRLDLLGLPRPKNQLQIITLPSAITEWQSSVKNPKSHESKSRGLHSSILEWDFIITRNWMYVPTISIPSVEYEYLYFTPNHLISWDLND